MPFVAVAVTAPTLAGGVRSTMTAADVASSSGPDVRDRVLDALRLERQGHGPVATAGQVDGPRGAAARRRPDDAPRGAPAGDQVRGREPADALVEAEREGEGRAFVGDAGGVIVTTGAAMSAVAMNASAAGAFAIPAPQPTVGQPSGVASGAKAVAELVSARPGPRAGRRAGARAASRRSRRRAEPPATSRCRCRIDSAPGDRRAAVPGADDAHARRGDVDDGAVVRGARRAEHAALAVDVGPCDGEHALAVRGCVPRGVDAAVPRRDDGDRAPRARAR